MDQSLLKNKLLIWFVALDLVAVNLAVGWVVYQKLSIAPAPPTTSLAPAIPPDDCGANCQAYIDSRISQLQSSKVVKTEPTPTPTPTPTPKTVGQSVPKAKVKNTTYLPIPSTGSTLANDWVNLSGTEFYFDSANYPGLVSIYFETNIRLLNGNGTAYVRLFDTVHGIGVQGSQVQTSSQTSTALESGQVSFWAGKILVRVQAKSLTADTAVFDGGRLRIITEN